MRTAETVAARMGHDGMSFENGQGETWAEVCETFGGIVEGDDTDPDFWRYEFTDGSAIAGNAGGWDVEGDEPFSWEGNAG